MFLETFVFGSDASQQRPAIMEPGIFSQFRRQQCTDLSHNPAGTMKRCLTMFGMKSTIIRDAPNSVPDALAHVFGLRRVRTLPGDVESDSDG